MKNRNQSLNLPPGFIVKKKSIDGLVKAPRKAVPPPASHRSQIVKSRPKVVSVLRPKPSFLALKPLHLYYALSLIVLSVTVGSYLSWRADKSFAQDRQPEAQAPAAETASPVLAVVPAGSLGPIAKVPNEILFNLTLDQLENYLAEKLKTPEMVEAENLALRKEKLKNYLAEKKSPFVSIVDTLAELKHWKMVLAISNSESTLGRNCYTNNCSGIGVEPGHPLWREYESTADWAKDLDKLLEKRYKDWTLDKMNGVYNKPGSENWLMASKQILEELQERNIE